MTTINLHQLRIPVDGDADQPLQDYSTKIASPKMDSMEVIFRNQEQRLLKLIKEFKNGGIFGCIAWLTSFPVLKALASCKNVSIIVQKEDFLRPDINIKNTVRWKADLWTLYNGITCEMERHQFKSPMGDLSFAAGTQVDGIRCVGNHNYEKLPAFPRAHNKFLVFCKVKNENDKTEYNPVAVWTGSYNITKTSTESFENVLYFTDLSGSNAIINAYLMEHHQIFALSEPLNWESVWTSPEFRIGS